MKCYDLMICTWIFIMFSLIYAIWNISLVFFFFKESLRCYENCIWVLNSQNIGYKRRETRYLMRWKSLSCKINETRSVFQKLNSVNGMAKETDAKSNLCWIYDRHSISSLQFMFISPDEVALMAWFTRLCIWAELS